MSDLRARAFALYKPPFNSDRFSVYVWDAGNNMVADFRGPAGTIRPRGWGRIQYMDDGAALHDTVETLILEATEKHPDNPAACVAALTALWEANRP